MDGGGYAAPVQFYTINQMTTSQICPLCKSEHTRLIVKIERKPIEEVDYGIKEKDYFREVHVCQDCGVYFSNHTLLNETFYKGWYNQHNHRGNLLERFNKIISLPFEKSDNKQRVERVICFLIQHDFDLLKTHILDIGSGTCVFLHEMKKYWLQTSCVDPDEEAVNHAGKVVGVNYAYHGSIDDCEIKQKYDIITLNKVLEHLPNPVETLKKVKKMLKPDGVIYIELPDGDPPYQSGTIVERCEFYIEHLFVYNEQSLKKLAKLAGLTLIESKKLVDPSGKFTVYGFLKLLT